MSNFIQEESTRSDETDVKIFEILVNWIENHYKDSAPITYSDLVNQLNSYSVIPVNVGMRLGRVSNYSKENNFPPISAIVGGLEFCEPGKGFFEALGLENLSSDKKLEKWVSLLKEVYSIPVEDWKNLYIEYKDFVANLGEK